MDIKHQPEFLINSLNSETVAFDIDNQSSYKYLAEKIGNARLVLLGEASHGTFEFYQARVELSKYLIEHHGFHAVAIEGDWTSAYPVNQYISGSTKMTGPMTGPMTALAEFNRFPKWMWRNETIPPFLQWLHEYNTNIASQSKKIGFYGLDLYCLSDSMQAVIDYLNMNNPIEAKKAMERYACFDHMAMDTQAYGYLIESGLKKACVHEATQQLLDIQRMSFEKYHQNIPDESDQLFYAMQNARVAKNAEHYYRGMFQSREMTWNIRDQHMVETLQNIISHLETKLNIPPKIIIWAHNSHVGDARATEMHERQEINLGQLVREQFGSVSYHIGFSTYTGTVTAASDWDEPEQTKQVNPGIPGSYEELFHHLAMKSFILDLHHGEHINHLLQLSRLQRAIGVIYRPDTERMSHYFFTHLPHQFDSIIHIDKTRAVKPL